MTIYKIQAELPNGEWYDVHTPSPKEKMYFSNSHELLSRIIELGFVFVKQPNTSTSSIAIPVSAVKLFHFTSEDDGRRMAQSIFDQ